MRDGGKGDKQRPLGVSEEQFNNNWDTIFKNGTPTLAELEKQREEARQFAEDAAQAWSEVTKK